MNNNSRKILTVIIPTREGEETLGTTIETVLNQSSDTFEVIVSNNFSQDNTEEIINSFTDNRLKYIKTKHRLSMCDHWDFALEHATGKYVLFIGDDDGVMPNALDRLQTFIQANPCKVYTWPKGLYTWPIAGQLPFVSYLGFITPPYKFNIRKLAHRALSRGGWGFTKLPNSYHSAIARSMFDVVRRQTGHAFVATNPDVFWSFAAPVFSKYAINIGFPCTIYGRSTKSNGAVLLNQDGKQNIEQFISEYGDYRLHPTLFPEAPQRFNYMFDSMLVAMDTFPKFYRQVKFNYSAMWTYLCLNPSFVDIRFGIMDVIRKSREISCYMPFSTTYFIMFYLVCVAYLKFMAQVHKSEPLPLFARQAPTDIRDLVRVWSEWLEATK